jgi:diaminopimelate epimerase
MNIKFTKMHGLGNDFIVLDAIHQHINFTSEDIAFLAKRDLGIGFDQCLIIEKSDQDGIDFFYRIFNADGQEVGQCGNGARCIARFLQYYQLADKNIIHVATHTTTLQLQINSDKTVTVNMGSPKLDPREVPLLAPNYQDLYSLSTAAEELEFHALSVGNPHAVLVVQDVQHAEVFRIGKYLSEHSVFPDQANVGFMQIVDNKTIRLRVYERGCGETNACGSGAVAAMAAGRLFHNLAEEVSVELPGGKLLVAWKGQNDPIFLTGPATFVYEGRIL